MRPSRLALLVFLLVGLLSLPHAHAATADPLIGEVERTYALPDDITELRGLLFDTGRDGARILALDPAGQIIVFRRSNGDDRLIRSGAFDVPPGPGGVRVASPRGLASATVDGRTVFHVVGWRAEGEGGRAELWTFAEGDAEAWVLDLSTRHYNIGNREVFGVARAGDRIVLSVDNTQYANVRERVRRGLIELRWPAGEKGPRFVRHLPNAGTAPSHAVATMSLDGADYLWGTVGATHLYVADGRTGRGLFAFDMPGDGQAPRHALAFGDGALWVGEPDPGGARVHRVNVTRHPEAVYEGPRIVRRLVMSIASEPEGPAPKAGTVTHTFSRPYPYGPLRNQGIWPETERVVDLSGAPNATIRTLSVDPAGDASSRQVFRIVEYGDAPARPYRSEYSIDMWMNPSRQFVYPHLVSRDTGALAGTDYLADDPVLYNLTDRESYDAFLARVRAYIEQEYGAPANMENPYWAARNIVDYILDHYYYPIREKGVPASVDYTRGHYDANPGNLKADLSRRPYDKTQIIACSGTSVTVGGALRHLGIPSRWLGTGTPEPPGLWDTNGNGFLDEGEIAPVSNGHRVNQVWLGPKYGWVSFDATPLRPAHADFDVPPPPLPQWTYMTRSAAGLGKPNRIVFNIGSTLIKLLFREFECNEQLAVNNDCGGDQRYNLQGRHERVELWKLPRHRITVRNLLFIDSVTVEGPPTRPTVTWRLKGDWSRDPRATISIALEELGEDDKEATTVAILAEGLDPAAGRAQVDLSRISGGAYRVVVRKDGDPETGNRSPVFELSGAITTASR